MSDAEYHALRTKIVQSEIANILQVANRLTEDHRNFNLTKKKIPESHPNE